MPIHTEAAKWYRKAAEQGLAKAQFTLGSLYARGQGIQQDDAKAVKWFRKAAEQGNAEAQYAFGALYASGRGVPQDYVLAHIWANLAASQGNKGARELRDLVAKEMTPDQIAEAQRLARAWKPK